MQTDLKTAQKNHRTSIPKTMNSSRSVTIPQEHSAETAIQQAIRSADMRT